MEEGKIKREKEEKKEGRKEGRKGEKKVVEWLRWAVNRARFFPYNVSFKCYDINFINEQVSNQILSYIAGK